MDGSVIRHRRDSAGMSNAKPLNVLMDRVCVDLGFCLPHSEIARIDSGPNLSPQDLADEIFRSEGLDPLVAETQLWRDVFWRVEDWAGLPRSSGRDRSGR